MKFRAESAAVTDTPAGGRFGTQAVMDLKRLLFLLFPINLKNTTKHHDIHLTFTGLNRVDAH